MLFVCSGSQLLCWCLPVQWMLFLRTLLLLSILVCPSQLSSLAVVLWGFCHTVVARGLCWLSSVCNWCCRRFWWVLTPHHCPRGCLLWFLLNRIRKKESLHQPQFPALMPRADLLLPILKVCSSVPGLLPKQQPLFNMAVSSPCGVVASVVSLEDTAQCHRALQRLSLSNVVEVTCVSRCAEALGQAGACCEDARVYHVI